MEVGCERKWDGGVCVCVCARFYVCMSEWVGMYVCVVYEQTYITTNTLILRLILTY